MDASPSFVGFLPVLSQVVGNNGKVNKEEVNELNKDKKCQMEMAIKKMKAELIPALSRKAYYKEYNIYLDWIVKEDMNVSQNATLLFLSSISTAFAPSTLMSKWSMIKV